MKKFVFVLLLAFLVSGMMSHAVPLSDAEGNKVCIAYFYAPNSENYQKIEPILQQMEENFSFLGIEKYSVNDYDELFLVIKEKYNISYDAPLIFVGNEWYYLNPWKENFDERIEALKNSIMEFEAMGGVECPVVNSSDVVFPKPVCMIEFYNFSSSNEMNEAIKFGKTLEENITYTRIIRIDTSVRDNIDNFENLCKNTNTSAVLPAIFIGDKLFPMNHSGLHDAVEEGKKFSKTGISCPEIEYESKEICIVLFYNPVCHECMEAKDHLDYLKFKYPLDIKEYNTMSDDGYNLLFKYYNAFDVSEGKIGSFAVFVGDNYFHELSQLGDMENEIKKHVDTGLKCPEPSEDGNAEKTVKGFTMLTVMAGGLVDGINPCAFATLIFFIAYMEKIKHEKKAMLSIGISFSLGVFMGYLFIGIGLMEFYYGIEKIGVISKYVYLFAGLFAMILAVFNIWDYFRIGKEEKTVLQLPKFLKRRRGRLIRVLTGDRHMMILSMLAFATGLGISMLEFVCTGQILFPIMAVIKSASPLKMTAFGYLMIYDVMFIMPLLTILALFYMGYTSEKLGEMQKRRQGAVKIVTAVMLAVIGAYMLYTIFAVGAD